MTDTNQQRPSAEQNGRENRAQFQQFNLSEMPPVVEQPPRAGDVCPRCHADRVDYDGLLNLVCPSCGFILAGCFT